MDVSHDNLEPFTEPNLTLTGFLFFICVEKDSAAWHVNNVLELVRGRWKVMEAQNRISGNLRLCNDRKLRSVNQPNHLLSLAIENH
jgi:hypothetical protein